MAQSKTRAPQTDRDEPQQEPDFEEILQDALREMLAGDGDFRTAEDFLPDNCSVSTYEEAGIMTTDNGLVVRTPDGREYQVTIIRSR